MLASYTPELLDADPPELDDAAPEDPELALASTPLDDPEVPPTAIDRQSPSA